MSGPVVATPLSLALASVAAIAQPCEWTTYGSDEVFWPSDVRCLTVFDDGSGPHVFAAGEFAFLTDGGKIGAHFSRWEAPGWSEPGGVRPSKPVNTMLAFDDGSGPALFVGGDFHDIGDKAVRYIARWDGKSWSYMDTGLNGYPFETRVRALAVFDDPQVPGGPQLYAAGRFSRSGDLSQDLAGIARWDGHSWHDVGGGLAWSAGGLAMVYSLAVYDDGNGAELYAGGYFDRAGGQPIARIARWDGSAWSAVGSPSVEGRADPDCDGIEGCSVIRSIAAFDDGTGPALFAAGHFQVPGLPHSDIARFRHGRWEAAGAVYGSRYAADKPMIGLVDLRVIEAWDGPALFLAGRFETADPPNDDLTGGCLARWDGDSQTWIDLHANPTVKAITAFDAGDGKRVWAGGPFATELHEASSIGSLGPDGWRGLIKRGRANSESNMIVSHDDGSGPAVYLAGGFNGGPSSPGIQRWNGKQWSPVGSFADIDPAINLGLVVPHAMAVLDAGTGPQLYVYAQLSKGSADYHDEKVVFQGVLRWDGEHWYKVGPQPAAMATFLFDFDDGAGRKLYFLTRNNRSEIWRYDWKSWSKWAQGHTDPEYLGQMFAAIEFDDGTGPALYVSGAIDEMEGVPVSFVARFRPGVGWEPAGKNLDQPVAEFGVWDDGKGPALYAAGQFARADGRNVNGIARWDGAGWQPLGSGFGPEGVGFRIFGWDQGIGRGMYVCGNFETAGGVAAANIARWNGAAWTALTGGLSGMATGITGSDLGEGRQVFATGSFLFADGRPSPGFAAWNACTKPPCAADLDGSESLDLFDFLTFLNSFNAQDSAADCDADGELSPADFACYSELFAAGCP